MRIREPGRDQHRALESKSVAMRRFTQPIEQTLQRIPRDHEIEGLSSVWRQFEEASTDGPADVASPLSQPPSEPPCTVASRSIHRLRRPAWRFLPQQPFSSEALPE